MLASLRSAQPAAPNRGAGGNAAHRRRAAKPAHATASPPPPPPPLPEGDNDLIARYPDAFRAMPLVAGAVGIVGVVANRVVSGVAPVVSATSAQSRADVVVIVLSAVLVLTGLQWLTLKPKDPVQVELEGEAVEWLAPGLPSALSDELLWVWDAVCTATRTRSVVLFYRGRCMLQAGVAAAGAVPESLAPGPICKRAMESGSRNYLANLVLFPGRLEFAPYLPPNCQAALVQPVGSRGVLVLGADTQRGFTTLDQAWVSAVADKLEVQLDRLAPGSGFKQQA